jgi:predicted AlkP superfamily phosphohydrolase/phosphomutase
MNRLRTLIASLLALTLSASIWGASIWAAPSRPGNAEPGKIEPGTTKPGTTKPGTSADEGRLVILGFDGADARTVRELMDKYPGRYPNFHKLAAEGTFAPLEVVIPAESPVSWASLNSGQNPAKTGVPGFIRRDLSRGFVLPGFGHIEKPKAVPLEEFENTPIPLWTAGTTAAVWGGATFLGVLLLALAVFRKLPVAAVMALIAGGGAAFAGSQVRALLPATYPRTANVNQVDSFWDHAARAGVSCVILDAAQSFDGPTDSGAKVLHGLGLPDARGEIGQWFIYTTDPAEFSREGKGTTTAGTVYRVDEEGGAIRSKVYGPTNFYLEQQLGAELEEVAAELAKKPGDAKLASRKSELDIQIKQAKKDNIWLEMVINLEGDKAHVEIDGQSQTLAAGEWSEFYELTFPLNWMLKVHAITRVKLVQLEPHFELLINVLDIDPRNPPFWQSISSPHGFAAELAADCGLYETYGWPTLTMPFKDKRIKPEILLEDVEFTVKWREVLTHQRLGKSDWDCLMSVFSTTDRVQHMLYQFYDEGHPLHDPEAAARETTFFGERIKLSEAIPAIYRQMDRIIGDVLAKLRPEDTLIVISDHGFQSFRRQVHINNWLIENGYMAVKPGLSKRNREALLFVDWSETRAYSLGLGFIYLNLEGREPKGIVARDDARALMDEIRDKLLAAKDPDNGESFCSEVYYPRDIHEGEFYGLEADMVTGFRAPYRVGWTTSSGGVNTLSVDGTLVPGPICSDNRSNWSGGHVSMDLNDIKGVFFSNREVTIPSGGVRALQIAPTALQLLGVDIPSEMDLPPLEIAP